MIHHGSHSKLMTKANELRPSTMSSALQATWPLLVAILIGVVMHRVVGPLAGGFATNVLIVIGINIMLAVSLNIVNGFTGQFSIGHAGFMAIGGYASAAIVYYGSIKMWGSADFAGGALSWTGAEAYVGPLIGKGDVLFVVACLAGGLVAAAAGYVVGLPSLRLRGDYLAIVTLGFGEIVRVILQGTNDQIPPWQAAKANNVGWYELPWMLGGPKGFNLLPTYSTMFWVYLFTVLTLIGVYRLKMCSSGRAFLSIREDEIASQAMGVDVTANKVRAFVLSSFIAGVAGGLYALYIGTISAADLGFQKSFDVVIMVVLGGLGSISGAALAAVLLSLLPELLRDPSPVISLRPYGVALAIMFAIVAIIMTMRNRRTRRWWWAMGWMLIIVGLISAIDLAVVRGIDLGKYRMIIYALLLILVMIARPQGLFGVNEVWDYFRRSKRSSSQPKAGAS